jgi:hypothetical protein
MSGEAGADSSKRPSQVLPFLYIGSRAHAKSRGLLRELGIKRVLNVTPPKTCVREAAAAASCIYI